MYDVIIIGAGVSGCAVACTLSRYRLKVCVVEKCADVCEGTSKANSGIMHGGYAAEPGSLRARLNVEGNRRMDELASKYDIPFRRNGSMVVCWSEEQLPKLRELLEKGKANGVPDLRIVDAEEAHRLEPSLNDEVYAALVAPTGGIVCPFEMTMAFAEVAAANDVEFRLLTEVCGIEKMDEGYRVNTRAFAGAGQKEQKPDAKDGGVLEARVVINAAGVYADVIHNMVSEEKIHITPRKGEYLLLDKSAGELVSHTIFQLPTIMGKGVLVTPTVHGNLLLGPTAVDIDDKEGDITTREGLSDVMAKTALSVKDIPLRQVITSFAGLRAHEDRDDFIIEQVKDAPGFIDVAGIESPGLSSAPAIGDYVKDIVAQILPLEEKDHVIEERRRVTDFASLPDEEKAALIAKNPAYGRIVCRCETVTEGEILEAIHRPLGARTLDGVKRRTRAGMGRCQAGFCTPRTMEILARELGCGMDDICKNEPDSGLIVGTNKDRY